MKAIVLIGRILFSFIFILTITSHFSSKTIDYAASAGVPMPSILVPLAGIIATLGGLSIFLGFKAKAGAWLIVLFLVPVTLYMHRFWSVTDPGMQAMQKINFMKNLSLIGAALIISQFGSGPLSVDNKPVIHNQNKML
jgi:putative oxidoreductase